MRASVCVATPCLYAVSHFKERAGNTMIVETVVSSLSQSQLDALAQKFAAQPKAVKQAVRALGTAGNESLQYATYIVVKAANDYQRSDA